MLRITRWSAVILWLSVVLVTLPAAADGQGRGGGRRNPPSPSGRAVRVPAVRGQFVFIGGYFYDPFFGPYPWWPRTAYPYWYFPIYDHRAEVRLLVKPEDAAVYVDGFYSGIVDDFNGVFQGLPLPPGGHEITLYLEGYRTVRRNLYLRPASTLKLRETMERLPAGETSEPPSVAPPVPPPPEGTFTPPVTPPRARPPAPATPPEAVGFGTLSLRIRPANASVIIDGERWMSSDEGQYTIQIAAGTHHVEVSAPGRDRFSTQIQVREGETVPLDVMLSAEKR